MSEPRTGIVRRRHHGNHAAARPLKIVVTGPFSAGKTTLIQTISEVAVVGTERGVTDATAATKEWTTVAMDFGRISFSEELSLFLFGTPGQRRFEAMWEVLSEGMIGFILLVSAVDDRSVGEGAHILESFSRYADVPYVVAVTHLDRLEGDPAEHLDRVRGELGLDPATDVMACDPRDRDAVKALLLRVLMGVMHRLGQDEAS